MYLSADPEDIMSPSGDHEHLIKFWNVNQKRIYDAFILWTFLSQTIHSQNLMATVCMYMNPIKPNIIRVKPLQVWILWSQAHASISIDPRLLQWCSLGLSHNLPPTPRHVSSSHKPTSPKWGRRFAWQGRLCDEPEITAVGGHTGSW